MMAIVGTFAFNFQVVFPLFVKETWAAPDTTFTILYAVVALGSLAGALITARRTSISHRDVIRGSILFGVSLVVLAFSPSLATTFPASLFLGFASILVITTTTSMVQLNTHPGDARTGAGAPGDGVARQHADRRPAAGRGVRGVRRARRIPRRRRRLFVAAVWGAAAVRRATGSGLHEAPRPEFSIGAATPNAER